MQRRFPRHLVELSFPPVVEYWKVALRFENVYFLLSEQNMIQINHANRSITQEFDQINSIFWISFQQIKKFLWVIEQCFLPCYLLESCYLGTEFGLTKVCLFGGNKVWFGVGVSFNNNVCLLSNLLIENMLYRSW